MKFSLILTFILCVGLVVCQTTVQQVPNSQCDPQNAGDCANYGDAECKLDSLGQNVCFCVSGATFDDTTTMCSLPPEINCPNVPCDASLGQTCNETALVCQCDDGACRTALFNGACQDNVCVGSCDPQQCVGTCDANTGECVPCDPQKCQGTCDPNTGECVPNPTCDPTCSDTQDCNPNSQCVCSPDRCGAIGGTCDDTTGECTPKQPTCDPQKCQGTCDPDTGECVPNPTCDPTCSDTQDCNPNLKCVCSPDKCGAIGGTCDNTLNDCTVDCAECINDPNYECVEDPDSLRKYCKPINLCLQNTNCPPSQCDPSTGECLSTDPCGDKCSTTEVCQNVFGANEWKCVPIEDCRVTDDCPPFHDCRDTDGVCVNNYVPCRDSPCEHSSHVCIENPNTAVGRICRCPDDKPTEIFNSDGTLTCEPKPTTDPCEGKCDASTSHCLVDSTGNARCICPDGTVPVPGLFGIEACENPCVNCANDRVCDANYRCVCRDGTHEFFDDATGISKCVPNDPNTTPCDGKCDPNREYCVSDNMGNQKCVCRTDLIRDDSTGICMEVVDPCANCDSALNRMCIYDSFSTTGKRCGCRDGFYEVCGLLNTNQCVCKPNDNTDPCLNKCNPDTEDCAIDSTVGGSGATCICRPGFIRDASIDRCVKLQVDGCFGKCVYPRECQRGTDGTGYYCSGCPDGYVETATGGCEKRNDNCATKCGYNAECTSTGDCVCRPGYERVEGTNSGDGLVQCLPIEQIPTDDCSNGFGQCPLNQRCVFSPSTNAHVCVCHEGYFGDDCSIKYCNDDSQCDVGFICQGVEFSSDNTQYRTCVPSSGSNPCDNSNCGENSFCVNGRCVCREGYVQTGVDCRPIEPGTCTNNNQVTVDGNCMCRTGFTGPNCDRPVCDDSKMCWNDNSHCVTVHDFNRDYCECRVGFSGPNCEKDVPQCACKAPRRCDNRGNCVCETGMTGADCSEKIPEEKCIRIEVQIELKNQDFDINRLIDALSDLFKFDRAAMNFELSTRQTSDGGIIYVFVVCYTDNGSVDPVKAEQEFDRALAAGELNNADFSIEKVALIQTQQTTEEASTASHVILSCFSLVFLAIVNYF